LAPPVALPGSAIDPTPTDIGIIAGNRGAFFWPGQASACPGSDVELAWIVRKKPIWSKS
jgi:hypothetical protein